MTIIALTCFLVVGAAAASILGRDSVPAAGPAMASVAVQGAVSNQGPVSNKEGKKDKLAIVTAALASFEPPSANVIPGESLRQAFAPSDIEAPKTADPAAMPAAPSKPKLASKPAPQKSYALLSDAQIAGIKDRLKLSSSQESY